MVPNRFGCMHPWLSFIKTFTRGHCFHLARVHRLPHDHVYAAFFYFMVRRTGEVVYSKHFRNRLLHRRDLFTALQLQYMELEGIFLCMQSPFGHRWVHAPLGRVRLASFTLYKGCCRHCWELYIAYACQRVPYSFSGSRFPNPYFFKSLVTIYWVKKYFKFFVNWLNIFFFS
jgi:hypothetical protein